MHGLLTELPWLLQWRHCRSGLAEIVSIASPGSVLASLNHTHANEGQIGHTGPCQQQQQLRQHSQQQSHQPSSALPGRQFIPQLLQQPACHDGQSKSFGGGWDCRVLQQQPRWWLSSSSCCCCSIASTVWHPTAAPAAAAARSLSTSSPTNDTHGDAVSSNNSSSGGSGGSGGGGDTWVQRHLPERLQPYAQLMRLEKPIGSWLLAWPGLWSIALAAGPGHLPDPWLSCLFGAGAVVMRGAGCTINDLWDRDIDRRVARTRSRPLAAGTLTPTAAIAFLGGQLSLGLAILLQLNSFSQALGVASLGLVVAYPLMKRVTFWPQAFLGLTFNYGVVMGWAAVQGSCDWAVVLPMYASGVAWTLVYDTIYAHQDKADDALVGVKSTALLFGQRTKSVLAGFAALQTAGLMAAGAAAGVAAPYYAAVAAGAAHQAWQLGSVDLDNGPDCMAKFVSNKWYGALIYAGIVASNRVA